MRLGLQQQGREHAHRPAGRAGGRDTLLALAIDRIKVPDPQADERGRTQQVRFNGDGICGREAPRLFESVERADGIALCGGDPRQHAPAAD